MDNILFPLGVALVLVLAVVIKLGFLVGLAAGVSRLVASDDAAVTGRWALRTEESRDLRSSTTEGNTEVGGAGGVSAHGTASSSPEVTARVAGALRGFVERDVSWLELERRNAAVRVISGDGTVVNYATDGCKIELRLSDGTKVQTTARWRGDELHLELRASGDSGDARVEEKYTPGEDPGCLQVDTRLIVPEGDLHMQVARTYDRTENTRPRLSGRQASET